MERGQYGGVLIGIMIISWWSFGLITIIMRFLHFMFLKCCGPNFQLMTPGSHLPAYWRYCLPVLFCSLSKRLQLHGLLQIDKLLQDRIQQYYQELTRYRKNWHYNFKMIFMILFTTCHVFVCQHCYHIEQKYPIFWICVKLDKSWIFY